MTKSKEFQTETVSDSTFQGMHVTPAGGMKHLDNKKNSGEIPVVFITALHIHMSLNRTKYPFGNWIKGLNYSMVLESIRRHSDAMRRGEDLDPETKSHHFLGVAANAMMGFVLLQLKRLADDRRETFMDLLIEEARNNE